MTIPTDLAVATATRTILATMIPMALAVGVMVLMTPTLMTLMVRATQTQTVPTTTTLRMGPRTAVITTTTTTTLTRRRARPALATTTTTHMRPAMSMSPPLGPTITTAAHTALVGGITTLTAATIKGRGAWTEARCLGDDPYGVILPTCLSLGTRSFDGTQRYFVVGTFGYIGKVINALFMISDNKRNSRF